MDTNPLPCSYGNGAADIMTIPARPPHSCLYYSNLETTHLEGVILHKVAFGTRP